MFTYARLTQGYLGSNTYILWDTETRDCALIDAGNEPEDVLEVIREHRLTVRYILLTHAHFDHICFWEEYRALFPEAVAALHALDDVMLPNPRLNASSLFGSEHVYRQADRTLREGEKLPLGNGTLEVLHTPGHTPGGICLRAENYLFTGDTLFYGSFGRTDLGAGSTADLSASVERLYALPAELTVLPGHGTKTTIGREERENPFMDF